MNIKSTNLRNKLASLLIMGFDGLAVNADSEVSFWIRKGLGGVILFDRDLSRGGILEKNIKDIDQIQSLIRNLKAQTIDHNHLWVAIDYEGGSVDRLCNVPGCPKTKTAQELAQLSAQEFDQAIMVMAETLHSLGFNLNFAPCVDLNLNHTDGIIGKLKRSFSNKPEITVLLAQRFVEMFNKFNITCCYKHFPGHGSALGDTHEGFVDVTDTFKPEEMELYEILCKPNELNFMIMTAHVKHRGIEPSGLPATMSSRFLTEHLRQKCHYNGVIISDDIQMKAVSENYSLDETIEKSLNAGCDMLIIGNQLGKHSLDEVVDCMESLVTNGKVTESQIDASLERISRLQSQ